MNYDTELELEDFIKEEEVNVHYLINKRYIRLIKTCFGDNEEQSGYLTKKYINNDRSVIEKFCDNDFFLLKKIIINTRKLCRNRKEIERSVNTLDFQKKLFLNSKSHRDFIIKNLELLYSNDYKLRREYNIDMYYEIMDYFIENIIREQNDGIFTGE